MNKLHLRIAVLATTLLALEAQAQASAKPDTTEKPTEQLALVNPAMQMQADPPAAGPRVAAGLKRVDVVRELQRAREAGELRWVNHETTFLMH